MKKLLYKTFRLNWKSKFLSFLAAVILSIYVHLLQSGVVSIQVPIVYTGLSSKLAFLKKPQDYIEVKLRSLKKVQWEIIQLKAEVDLTLASTLNHKYQISFDKSFFPRYVSMINEPTSIELRLDHKLNKLVPVKITFSDPEISEMNLSNLVIQPKVVRIQGASKILNTISSVSTVPLHLDENQINYSFDSLRIKKSRKAYFYILEKSISISFILQPTLNIVRKVFKVSRVHPIGLSQDLLLEQPDYQVEVLLEGPEEYIDNILIENISIGIELEQYVFNEKDSKIEPFNSISLSSIQLLNDILKSNVTLLGVAEEQKNLSLNLQIKSKVDE